MGQTQEALGYRGPDFNLLTATRADLQKLLRGGETNSRDFVEIYLNQIETHNKHRLKLNAMMNTTPKNILLSIAEGLDDNRNSGKIRGPLHGIPVTVKVNILIEIY